MENKSLRPNIKYDPWPVSLNEAREVQEALRGKVRIHPPRRPLRNIAALDAAFGGGRIVGAACLLTYPGLELMERAVAVRDLLFPYVPGYLSFREGPVLMEAVEGLAVRPDLLLLDGQGTAHPRGLGIASHLGVLLDTPSIGCAKSRLTGDYREPGRKKGMSSLLRDALGRPVGAVLRTRDNTRPVFVSPGHRMDIMGSIKIVLACTGRYRIPEPLRCADGTAKAARKCYNLL
jgi:deoxyribonuclease V